jgi:hypothetical protein
MRVRHAPEAALIKATSLAEVLQHGLSRHGAARVILIIAFCIALGPSAAAPSFAQTHSPGDEMLARDRLLGSGCNEIGLGIPSSDQPLQPDQEWLDSHSVCVPDRLRGSGFCLGLTDGVDQVELRFIIAGEGDGTMAIDCEDIILDTDSGLYGPHRQLTDSTIDQAKQFVEDRNLGIEEMLYPCTQRPTLSDNTLVLAAFDGLTPTEEPVVLRINVETGKFVAIIADEPSIMVDVPAD